MTASRTPLTAAVVYARRGWPVFPCHTAVGHPSAACTCGHADCASPGKHPRIAGGLRSATTDEATIRRWWARWPRANVALRTGSASGLVVVDVDPAHGGGESLLQLFDQYGRFVDGTRAVRTGGGGWHFYFEHPGTFVKNDTGRRLGPGIDVRGDGGYVLAPPSVHASGGTYELGEGARLPAPLPEWLVERLTAEPERRLPPAPTEPVPDRWAAAALDGEMERLLAAKQGCRNDTLNRIAFRLGQIVAAGGLDESRVEQTLVHGAVAIGLGEREASITVRSGLRAGEQVPRGPREREADLGVSL
jgi:hypothetical protein